MLAKNEFINKINSQEILAECEMAFSKLSGLSIDAKVDLINSIRAMLHRKEMAQNAPAAAIASLPNLW